MQESQARPIQPFALRYSSSLMPHTRRLLKKVAFGGLGNTLQPNIPLKLGS